MDTHAEDVMLPIYEVATLATLDAEAKVLSLTARLKNSGCEKNEALRLLGRYLCLIKQFDLLSDARLVSSVTNHVASLVEIASRASLKVEGFSVRRGRRAAKLMTLKRWAETHLCEPCLSVSSAAAACSVSPRHIQRLFEDDGTTFSAFVLESRLRLARQKLSSMAFSAKTIGEIAFACGFGDLSYFDRAFRTAFGETPSETRRRAA